MMSKIQNLNGTHNVLIVRNFGGMLFMMSKIQNLNGTHNLGNAFLYGYSVVYDVKDTKFEWNSQRNLPSDSFNLVVYDVKDTKFEWNSQRDD